MSESSYNKASQTHHAEGSTGAGSDAYRDPLSEPEDVSMSAEEYPIRGLDDAEAVSFVEGMPDETNPAPETSEGDFVAAGSGFFGNGQLKKKPAQVAKSFSDEFIDTRDPISDEEYFINYQKGDDKSFFILYERYRSSVYAYCARVLLSAGLGEELVEDTFQEVFLRVSQYRNSFHSGEFRAWIFTVTRNTCLSSKKRGLKNLLSTNGAIDPDQLSEEEALGRGSQITRSDDPLERLALKEQTDLLLKAISELPETYREALMLSEYEGLTYEEIGKLTGTSLSTIRIRVFRAKKRLRKVLHPILGEEYIAGVKTSATKEDEDEE